MKFTLAVMAATAATASAGVCCCGVSGASASVSYQCGAYGDYDEAYTYKTYLNSDACNGDNTPYSVSVSSCDAYDSFISESGCTGYTVGGVSCTWNSAASTALAAASAAAAVVAYAM
mmetsp:Transcript_51233/g.76027  ORF Transcript_51233/g.76027 Transcript_51233/m.76027 type:complete len:117 (-) Transcript_51233:129-479(-)|eukprot:CAMPEP_0195513992 /NCGR_PEP_ID=MMETSP0794_2-20130614/5520_1 /TAXON_ID=515487 /ORGANISM="Stephanopyxis turris, Strain CCMP 815" /LENGTH=116 /DNA_ID=CAMNT_0040642143 /DNA_START=91 /DNA_END=441 /DNA_ORIENTATION=-